MFTKLTVPIFVDRLDGGVPCDNPAVHGDGAVSVHHLLANPDRGGEGDQNQGGDEDHGPQGFRLLVSSESFLVWSE